MALNTQRLAGFVFLLGLVALSITGFSSGVITGVAEGSAATPVFVLATATPGAGMEMPGMQTIEDRLARPTLPANPSQADMGSQVYYYVCMACHGDQGQGLSPEWVEAWELGEETCWQSRCHASNHPPEGFELPKYIPPVVGPVIPARFETALDLYTYIQEKMPWHAPGSLTEEEYWQVSAFLVRANGVDPGLQPLDKERAAAIRLRTAPTPTPTAAPGIAQQGVWLGGIALIGFLLLILLVKLLYNGLRG